MRILASIHLYPPKHNCGGEYMMHQTLKYLQSEGHEVRVLLWQANRHKIENLYTFDGVDVFPPTDYMIDRLFDWCDVIFTHLDYTQASITYGAKYKKKVVHFVHNWSTYGAIEMSDRPQYIVYNSEVAKRKLNYKHDSVVLHPPVDWRWYDTNVDPSLNQYVTLVNLDYNKGGNILSKIAERMPNTTFLGVLGSYSSNHMGQYDNQPPNVKVVPNTTTIKQVYQMTRVIIMPSEFESWGRVATEAMCSGIPVICNPTEGLMENCGDAGIYVDREDIDGWVKAITMLENQKTYRKWSKAAMKRSRELDPVNELKQFNTWLCTLK